jgi:hypothetical protein
MVLLEFFDGNNTGFLQVPVIVHQSLCVHHAQGIKAGICLDIKLKAHGALDGYAVGGHLSQSQGRRNKNSTASITNQIISARSDMVSICVGIGFAGPVYFMPSSFQSALLLPVCIDQPRSLFWLIQARGSASQPVQGPHAW